MFADLDAFLLLHISDFLSLKDKKSLGFCCVRFWQILRSEAKQIIYNENEQNIVPVERSSIFRLRGQVNSKKIRSFAHDLSKSKSWSDHHNWLQAEKTLCLKVRHNIEEDIDSFYPNLELLSSLSSLSRLSTFMSKVDKGQLSIFVDLPETKYDFYPSCKYYYYDEILIDLTIYVGPIDFGHEVIVNCFGDYWESFYEANATWKENINLFGKHVEVWQLNISMGKNTLATWYPFVDCLKWFEFDAKVVKKDNFGNIIETVKDDNEGNLFRLKPSCW